jgi:SNF2 family DNA or RNA helicase
MIVPYKHQVETIERFKDQPIAALFCECGLGKTHIAIKLLENHFDKERVTAAVIVTTSGLVGNWGYVELPAHSSVPHELYLWKKTKTLPPKGNLLYFIINVDGLLADKFPMVFTEFLKLHPKFAFVVDESTIIKSPAAARSKRAVRIARMAAVRMIMSGTPIVKSPDDLFNQCEVLGKSLLGFDSKFEFNLRYAKFVTIRVGHREIKKITGWRNLDTLTESLKPFSVVLKKTDCLDLPEKIYRTVPVDFTPEQARIYNDLRDEAVTMINSEQFVAVNAVSLINKLLQVSSGQLKKPDGEYIRIKNNRLQVLRDLVDECPGKTIIWAAFVNNAKDIVAELGDDVVHLPSGLDVDARHNLIEEWRTSEVKALVANPASMGHGVTLTEASNVIYYSRSFNYEHRAQSEDRAHRIGQKSNVLYTDLIAPGTVEEKVVNNLLSKRELSDRVLTRETFRELLS